MRVVAALLLLATHTAAAATLQPTVKPALAQNHKLQLAPDAVATIVTLRGGATLGPITPAVGAWLQVVLEAYFLALMSGNLKFLPALPFMGGDPYAKYGWTETASTKPLQTQFAGAIGYLLSITFAATYWGDAAAHVNVCRGSMLAWLVEARFSFSITPRFLLLGSMLAWLVCGGVFFGQFAKGTTKFTEGNVMCVVLPLLFGYLGFA